MSPKILSETPIYAGPHTYKVLSAFAGVAGRVRSVFNAIGSVFTAIRVIVARAGL
jgi:hypothetical protein